MATQLFANNASSTLASGITNVATSLTLATGQGALFPNPTGGDWFLLTLTQATGVESSWEIVKVTARTTDTLTIVRAQEGTTAAAWSAGAKAEARLTAGSLIPAVVGGQNGLLLGSDKTKLDALSGTNSGDNAVNSLYSGMVTNATHTGDVTGSGALTIANSAVTYAKMQNVSATSRVLGRITAAAGVVEELTGANLATIIGITNTAANVNSVNGVTGAVTAANISAAATTGYGFTPYSNANPSGYTTNTGTVTGVTGTAPVTSSGGTAPAISMAAATSVANGYMTSTYAAKLDGIAAGATANTGTVTGVTGTAPVVSSGGTAPAISMAAATSAANGYMTSTYAAKLDGIAASANNYTHPASHAPSIITQDASNRFVTDTEKSTWNGKQAAGTYASGTGSASGTNTGDETLATIKTKLGITTLSGANTGDQSIPTTLPASDVYAWAKAATKPSYSASEVGLGSVNNTADSAKSVNYATTAGSAPASGGTSAACSGEAARAKGLQRSDSASDTYNVQSHWGGITAGYWALRGYNGTTFHAECMVGYATNAGYASSAGSAPASDVSAWAKAGTKPTYTASEVGLGSVNNTADSAKSVSYAATAGSAPANGGTATNSTNAGGLAVATGVNNVANQIVRTNANGYCDFGWINTISGDNGTTAIDRIYASGDAYLRYYSPVNFRTVLDVPTRGGSGASGSWAISVTGSSASCSGTALYATTAGSAPANGGTSAACSGNAATASSTPYATRSPNFDSTSHTGTYWLVNNWDGTYWSVTSNHGSGVKVAYATYAATAGSAPASDVYAWAKAGTKPSYSAAEVGSDAAGTPRPASDVYAWAKAATAPASTSALVLLQTLSLTSASSVVLDAFSSTYDNYQIVIAGVSEPGQLTRINVEYYYSGAWDTSSASYSWNWTNFSGANPSGSTFNGQNNATVGYSSGAGFFALTCYVYDVNSTNPKVITSHGRVGSFTASSSNSNNAATTALTKLRMLSGNGYAFVSGSVSLYGVKK